MQLPAFLCIQFGGQQLSNVIYFDGFGHAVKESADVKARKTVKHIYNEKDTHSFHIVHSFVFDV